jgi:hypothetical protein
VWEIRERGKNADESDPALQIAKYFKNLEHERALRKKWKMDREIEIKQSMELRRRSQANNHPKRKLPRSQTKSSE